MESPSKESTINMDKRKASDDASQSPIATKKAKVETPTTVRAGETSTVSSDELFDVVVCGAGLAGLTAAFRLAQQKKKVSQLVSVSVLPQRVFFEFVMWYLILFQVLLCEAYTLGGRTKSLPAYGTDAGSKSVSVGGTWAILEDNDLLSIVSSILVRIFYF